MTHLYSCRHEGDQYRLTKLTTDLEVESSYLVSADACECPGFERRQHCRHLDMLPRFIARGMVGGTHLHDFERNAWVRNPLVECPTPSPEPAPSPDSVTASTAGFGPASVGSNPARAANPLRRV